MKIQFIAAEPFADFLGHPFPQTKEVEFIFSAQPMAQEVALIIDPFFEEHTSFIETYQHIEIPVLIGSVAYTLDALQVKEKPIARFNAWRPIGSSAKLEVSASAQHRDLFNPFFDMLGITPHWVPDEIGFITPRVIACIINEAYIASEEGVADADAIDTAMQLGTNYPLGPFAWCNHIGKKNVVRLLEALATFNPIYSPAASLLK